MEFKDNLKHLRKKKGITQQELADAIYVSRSAVAKWENGLGLPGEESMKALEDYFEICQKEIATSEPETVIIQKNQKLRNVCALLASVCFAAVAVCMLALPFLIQNGSYGFTPEMAAGAFANAPYIDTGDYRIYYSSFEGDWEDGRHWYSLAAFRPVEKNFWGCTVSDKDYDANIILDNNTMVGRLYSIKGQHGYYNLIANTMSVIGYTIPDYIITIESISISGVEYTVQHGFFFITPEPVDYFKIGDVFLNVE